MVGRCAVVGCDMTADAAWLADDGKRTGDVIEVALCGLHYPDLASGMPWTFDRSRLAITLG